MDSEIFFEHPWQQSPAEMLSFAITNLNKSKGDKDLNNLISFLMFDVSIEALFKVYLSIPDEITKVKVKYHKRCKAIKGGFHGLVKCIEKCAGEKLIDINLAHIENYHRIRNKLYHGSDATTIDYRQLMNYAELAVKLHKILLDIDMTKELNREVNDSSWDKESLALSDLHKEVELCMEIIAPDLLLPSFNNKVIAINEFEPFKALWDIYSLIEDYFSVNSVECFSEIDIALVSRYLEETSKTDISNYPSEKDIILQVKSCMIGWEYMQIKNLPFGKYKVNSLEAYDFFQFYDIERGNSFFNAYLKAICDIIDSEVAIGNYQKPINNLMSVANDCFFFTGNAYYSGDYDPKEMTTSIIYLHDCIREWRMECLQI